LGTVISIEIAVFVAYKSSLCIVISCNLVEVYEKNKEGGYSHGRLEPMGGNLSFAELINGQNYVLFIEIQISFSQTHDDA